MPRHVGVGATARRFHHFYHEHNNISENPQRAASTFDEIPEVYARGIICNLSDKLNTLGGFTEVLSDNEDNDSKNEKSSTTTAGYVIPSNLRLRSEQLTQMISERRRLYELLLKEGIEEEMTGNTGGTQDLSRH